MKIVCHNGMVNIDSESFTYANIKSMYETGDGHGLQVSRGMEGNESEILELCSEIADRLYKLQELERGE